MLKFVFLNFVAILLAICMTGCTPSDEMVSFDDMSSLQQEAVSPKQANTEEFTYKFGIGDKLRVMVYQEKDLSGNFEIDSRGMISMPYIQDIKAAGASAQELAANIEKTFMQKNILKDPKVSIDVLNYRPFYIQGEVNKGGEYPYKSNMDIRNAVAIAGGYTYRAEQTVAYVRREGQTKVMKVDLANTRFSVYPGDNIKIPERFF